MFMLLVPAVAAAQADDALWTRPLDELMQVEVISVGKKEQRVIESAAAVYVLTSDEIRRSGLTTVPDLLRLVPGLTVARIDANKWSVSVRGFSSRFANKLLVMIDGRSLYSRMFSGVFWDSLGVPVAEIERIEVVRGPGASLWGANAVNGIINIVTRSASAGPGTRIVAGAGLEDRWSLDMSHARAGQAGGIRLFGHFTDRDGTGGFDSWRTGTAGMRFERRAGGGTFSFDTSASHGDGGQRNLLFRSIPESVVPRDVRAVASSWTGVARYVRPTRKSGEWQIIATQEAAQRYEPEFFDYTRRISDVGIQHRIRGLRRHDLIWGTSFRYLSDDAKTDGPTLVLDDTRFRETLYAGFVQDEVSLTKRLKVTLGTKVEHTEVSGWNAQPTVRAWWSPDGNTAFWGAVSRAIRTPSWADTSVRFNMGSDTTHGPLPMLFSFIGNPDVEEERLAAYESGARTTIGDRVALDVTGFYNRYRGLTPTVLQAPVVEFTAGAPHLLIAATPMNVIDADTAGVEAVAVTTLTPTSSLTGTFEIFRMTDWRTSHPTATADFVAESTPRYQWTLRYDGTRRGFEYGASLVSAPRLDEVGVPAYLRLDARLSRRLKDGLEIALIGQNLLHSKHFETVTSDLVATSYLPRAVSVRATWHLN
jgi:iron complex outermembrane receptor protein